ncbi:MAG: hypothetical protein R3D26_19520 [Cyanobacteriota/Melainabacteria group bacterium]
MVLKSSKRAVRMRASDNYPAPGLAIEVMETGFNEGLEAGLAAEIEAFSKVAVSDTARNMINFYFHKEMASQMAIRAASKFGTLRLLPLSAVASWVAWHRRTLS